MVKYNHIMQQEFNDINDSILNKPIPVSEVKRDIDLSHVELDKSHPLFNDPIVKLSDYGVRGRSYYAHQQWFDSVEGLELPKEAFVRQDIAERLAVINDYLNSDRANFIKKALGYKNIDLYVTDAYRPMWLVKKLYSEIYPNNLRRDHPDWNEEQVISERDIRCAKPSPYAAHLSGGAIDVVLSNKDTGQKIPNGVLQGDPATVRPRYYEELLAEKNELSEEEHNYLLVRRVQYHLLSASRSKRSGYNFVNTREIWHYGTGDYLSAKLAGKPAYYIIANED